jgi:5'-deoxynucleotidase YfbR-like HD superfamily hydrolase
MQLNIKEMIGGSPARLRWVYRYSTSRVRHPESVAEHSFFVAFYALMVGRWVNNKVDRDPQQMPVNIGLLLSRAVIHDVEECATGDFPRNFKHGDPELHKLLENAAKKEMKGILDRLIEGPDQLGFYALWLNAKDPSSEGRILEFCDFLAVLGFLLQEGMGEGNGTIGVHVEGMSVYYGKFQRTEYQFLQPLVEECGTILEQLGILDSALVKQGKGDS